MSVTPCELDPDLDLGLDLDLTQRLPRALRLVQRAEMETGQSKTKSRSQ
jgi:hypothetical protein